jgi:hypothetical protein
LRDTRDFFSVRLPTQGDVTWFVEQMGCGVLTVVSRRENVSSDGHYVVSLFLFLVVGRD